MKPRGDDSSSRSCSCTSCFYKSESDHPSIRHMLAKGSRIDKLFIGKYLPLREEKLLKRLVRTRAIYDDIRIQLLSDSNVSESDKGDLKPAKRMPLKREGKRKDIEFDAERSSVLLQLINLVDRGATLGPHRLSECCSCCVCGSKANKFAGTDRLQKHKHRHVSSRSSFTSGMRTRDERRLANHGHRARYIRSDPGNCACKNEDNDLNVRGSKAMLKKDRIPDEPVVPKDTGKGGGRQDIKDFKTRQETDEALSRSMTKLKPKSQMSAKLRSKIKKSTEIMKTAEQKVRGKIRKHTKRYKHSEILYSLRGGKHRKKTKEELELEVEEAIAKIKKDSLTKFKEDMKKKKFNKKWACDFECDQEECEPEECLKIKMQQRGEKRVHYKNKNIGDSTRILSKTQMSQTKISEAVSKIETKKQETKLVDLKKNTEANDPQIQSKIKHNETEINQPKKSSKSEGICECKTTTSSTNISKRSVKSKTELLSTTPKTSSASETISQKRTKPKAINVKQKPKRNVQSGGYALKRCFCTLKLRPKEKRRQRPQSSDSKSVQTKTSKTLSTTTSTTLKRIKQRKERTNSRGLQHPTKSTSSVTSKSSGGTTSGQAHSSEKGEKVRPSKQLVIKRKDDDKPISNKQAVRISSSFSFNIEFYKDTPSTRKIAASETETQSQVARLQKRTHKRHSKVRKHKHLAHKHSQMTSSAKSKNTLTKHHLRRCFCTLKFAKKDVICECAPKVVTYSKGTLTSGQSLTEKSILRNTGTEKRLKRPKYAKYQLLPYECEPGICVPGECDPYQCLELINKRSTKLSSRGFGTYRKTKSTYSITERRAGRSNTKKIQSGSTTYKENKSLVIPQRKVASSPSRQAVRISSSFSFNIEFYKDKPKDTQDIEIVNKPSSSTNIRNRGSQQKYNRKHHKSISVQSNTKEKGIFVGSAMKHCFCTLKLQKKAKKQVVSCECSTTATDTFPTKNTIHLDMVTRSTQMKKKINRQGLLLPYECEPGICVTDECDPYQCLERIKIRNKKLKDFGTETNRIKNKSAALTTSSSSSRNALTQSNIVKVRKKRKRSKYTTSSSYPKVPIPVVSSHQAVRLGSHFSFSVEFAKEQPQGEQFPDELLIKKPVRNVRMKQEGEYLNKSQLKHSESQSMAVKKMNKGSRIKPSILKKCFCTLKLQNKKANLNPRVITKPIEAIVMPAQVFNKSFALSQYKTNQTKYVLRKRNIEQNEIDRSSIKLYPLMATKLNNMNWFSRNISTLSTEFPFNINKPLTREDRGSIRLEKNISKNKTTKLNLRCTELMGVSPYLKKSFYALNLQVQNHQRKMHKLLPYECEPGVCVPGECDPYECQKLINKRLMKRSSTMTTTDNRSQSTSSGGTHVTSSQQQFGRTHQERADKGDRVVRAPRTIKYESPPNQPNKQAVRIGSTFSFDIEFFKDKSPGNKSTVQEKRRRDHNVGSGSRTVRRNHKITSGSQVLRHNKPSQSSIMTHDKGQNIIRPKRCFCTLKLQKRGKQYVQVGHEAKPPVQYTNTGQNTVSKNSHYKLLDLDPNECEPGVCVPGECDPYECLERIKRRNRKDIGSGMRPSLMSSSSMTSQLGKHGKNVQINKKRRKSGVSKSTVSSVSRPNVTKNVAHPSRQAVRISSNFSFNIEFFKDRSYGQSGPITGSGAAPVKMTTKTKDNKQNTGRSRSLMGSSSQDSIALRHQNTQHYPNTKAIGTKTGEFLKRCFCTAKLFQKSPPKDVKAVGVSTNVKATKLPKHECVSCKNTKNSQYKLLDLDPNECEPGVCIPGECDPYECLERIKRRRRKDIGSGVRPSMMSSSSMTSQFKKHGKHVQINKTKRKSDDRPSVNKTTAHSSSNSNVDMTTKPKDSRQAVRIGSNFSFNVEFYKDKSHGQGGPITASSAAPVKLTTKTKDNKQNTRQSPSLMVKSSQDSTALRHQNTQHGPNTKTIGTKTGAFLKRCFCTAKFFQKSPPNDVQVVGVPANVKATPSLMQRCLCTLKLLTAKSKSKHASKVITGVSSQTLNIQEKKKNTMDLPKLEPYECEPGVCVPGQCDPYECLERINKRKRLNKIVSTENTGTRSKSTGFRSPRSVGVSYAHKEKKSQPVSTPVDKPVTAAPPQNRDAVRIGSNFSFNVEFYKDQISPTYQNVQRAAKEVKKRHAKSSASVKTRRSANKYSGVNKYSEFHSSESQADLIKKEDRATGNLKRCFCTLALHKQAEKDKVVHEKSLMVKEQGTESPYYKTYPNVENKNTITKKSHKLEPYECEPGVCIPGECDPYECLKRIQRRREQGTSTPRHRTSSSSTLKRAYRTSSIPQSVIKVKKAARPSQQRTRPSRAPRPSRQRYNGDQGQHRQAVKIGSNFSFNIEFSKSRTDGDQAVKIRKEPRADRNETRSTSSKPERKRSTKRTTSQASSRVHSAASQVLRNKVHSTLTETKPFLKRCFCTLKFKNMDKKPHELMKPSRVSKLTQHRDIGISTPKEKPFKNLLPYECEPGVCIPGQCDPYECLKRIEKRNMQSKMASTDRHRGRGVSITTAEKKTSSKGLQNQKDVKPKRTYGHSYDGKVTPTRKQHVNHSARNKKAVRLGSNFNFDVEFTKDKTNKTPFYTGTSNVYSTLVTTNKDLKMSRCYRKPNNSQLQSITRKTASTGSGVGSSVKRCFCALKLQKLGRLQRPSRLRTNSKVIKKPIHCTAIQALDYNSIQNKDTGDHGQHRQAVKIGSNISFNIEFSKNRTGGGQAVKIKKEPRANRNETRCTSSKPERKSSTKRTISQASSRVHNAASQVLGCKVHCTSTETKPFLNRCFCTLKLKNMDKKPQAPSKSHEVMKPSRVSKLTQHRDIGICTQKEKSYKTLLPYECEPGVCIPGRCCPYECLKRIEKRNMQNKTVFTDRHIGRGVSINTAEKKTSCKSLQNQTNFRPKRTNGQCRDGKVTRMRKQNVTHAKNKKAVRLGSSFSFDVEFSKDKINKNPFYTNTQNIYSTLVSTRNITDADFKKYSSKMSSSDRKLNNNQSGSNATRTTSTELGAGPSLKRCFCTVKLQKLGRQQRQSRLKTNSKIITKPISNDKPLISTSIQYKDTGIGSKKRLRGAESVCLAERKSLVKILSDKTSDKKSIEIRSKDKNKNLNLSEIVKSDNHDRQAVRIGSNFSFNIEFFKEHSPEHLNNVTVDTLPKIDKTYNTEKKKLSKTNRSSFDKSQCMCYKEVQEKVGQERKVSGIKPLIQKCLCTLKLLDNNKLPGPDVQVGHEAKPPLQYKNTGQNTKKSLRRLSHLNPNECEPGVCIPGECDPYECLEIIKSRNNRHLVTRVSHNCKCSQASLTSFGPTSKFKSVQYSPKQKKQDAKMLNIVEQPRFPFTTPEYYRGLKIGSNVSFNIEFFKEHVLPTSGKETKRISMNMTSGKETNRISKNMTSEKVKKRISQKSKNIAQAPYNQTSSKPDLNKRPSVKTKKFSRSRNRTQQADAIKTEDKSFLVGNALKRCFCTAKLVDREKIMTVGRVDKLITNSPFQPRKLQIYQMHQPKVTNRNKENSLCDSNCILLKNPTKTVATKINEKNFIGDPPDPVHKKTQKRDKNADEMKTILPYAPKKFNKTESKTLVMPKSKSNKKYCCAYCKDTCVGSCVKDDVPRYKNAKRLTGNEEKTFITKPNTFKRLMCTCLNTVLKNKNKSKGNSKPTFLKDDEKTESKTLVLPKSKSNKKYCCAYCKDTCEGPCVKDDVPRYKSAKKFTGKQEKALVEKQNIYKRLICPCLNTVLKNKNKSKDNSKSTFKIDDENNTNTKVKTNIKISKCIRKPDKKHENKIKKSKVTSTKPFVCPKCHANFDNSDKKTIKSSKTQPPVESDFENKSMSVCPKCRANFGNSDKKTVKSSKNKPPVKRDFDNKSISVCPKCQANFAISDKKSVKSLKAQPPVESDFDNKSMSVCPKCQANLGNNDKKSIKSFKKKRPVESNFDNKSMSVCPKCQANFDNSDKKTIKSSKSQPPVKSDFNNNKTVSVCPKCQANFGKSDKNTVKSSKTQPPVESDFDNKSMSVCPKCQANFDNSDKKIIKSSKTQPTVKSYDNKSMKYEVKKAGGDVRTSKNVKRTRESTNGKNKHENKSESEGQQGDVRTSMSSKRTPEEIACRKKENENKSQLQGLRCCMRTLKNAIKTPEKVANGKNEHENKCESEGRQDDVKTSENANRTPEEATCGKKENENKSQLQGLRYCMRTLKKAKRTPEEVVNGKNEHENKSQSEVRQSDKPCCYTKKITNIQTPRNLDPRKHGLTLTKEIKILPVQKPVEKPVQCCTAPKPVTLYGSSFTDGLTLTKDIKILPVQKPVEKPGQCCTTPKTVTLYCSSLTAIQGTTQDKKGPRKYKIGTTTLCKKETLKGENVMCTSNLYMCKPTLITKEVTTLCKEPKFENGMRTSDLYMCTLRKKKGTKGAKVIYTPCRNETTKGEVKCTSSLDRAKQSENSCICGSSVCAKLAKKKRLAQIQQKPKPYRNPCVCGNPVCAKEARKRSPENTDVEIDEDTICKCYDPSKEKNEKKEKKKQATEKYKELQRKHKKAQQNKKLAVRRRQYAKEDAILRVKRLKREFEMNAQVLQTKDSGDCALFTESMLDIAKLGCTTAGDVLRSTYRSIMDPKHTGQNIKTCVLDPRRGLTIIKQAFTNSGLASTCKRVWLRFSMMKKYKCAKERLESCGVTNYLIHIADKDPRKRMKPTKRKIRKVHEPIDFECSPYMASLRRRPWIAVHYLCPWFYPHCLNMLYLWKQFTDVLLFLLAVVVWSPCILLMEVCRAMMCCFLCTG